MKRRRQPPRIPSRAPVGGEGDVPPLIELERFSQASLKQWRTAAARFRSFHQAYFYGLEQQRLEHSADLIEALQRVANAGPAFEHWARIVDYRYSNEPMSVAGSLRRIGGRFNIGEGIDVAAFTPFPALYIAENYDTAFRERFALAPGVRKAGLSGEDLGLRTPISFAHVALRGQLELLIDARRLEVLQPFAQVLARFTMPKTAAQLARTLGLKLGGLVRTASGVQRQLIDPYWRMQPMQFDLPSNSQVFGRIAQAAGIHGILYPSARNVAGSCLALFPQNWKRSSSFVEVMDGAPSGARLTRIDGSTPSLV